MKTKVLIGMLVLVCSASLFAQGSVVFVNHQLGILDSHVYSPEPFNGYLPRYGDTATEMPSGTQMYGGAPITGRGYTAQLWAANGSNQPESALQPAAAYQVVTTFRTGASAGYWAQGDATLAEVPENAPVATLQVRVFQTSYGSWDAALAAFNADWTGTVVLGKSLLFNVENIGGPPNFPPYMVGLQSFSLIYNIPEPSSLSIVGVGLAALLSSRRK